MIRFSDAAILALTKLRTRKIRTIVTIVTGSLLFGALVAATLVVGGVVDSAKRFTSGSLSERYIANVQYSDMNEYYINELTSEREQRVNDIYKEIIANKTREAKRLGIPYDSSTEQKPITKDLSGMAYLDYTAPAAVQLLREHVATLPSAMSKVKEAAASYRPTTYYEMKRNASISGRMTMMKDGVEDEQAVDQRSSYSMTPDVSGGWSYLDASITSQFLLDPAVLAAQKNTQDLPVIAPYSKVEAALGLKKLPQSATPQERLDRIEHVRKQAGTATFTVCYRNQASKYQIDEARRVAKEIEQNKANKNYQKPSLIYGLPTPDSCGAATVIHDVRTAAEKRFMEKQQEFERLFSEGVDPVQKKVVFRVVGLGPDGYSNESFSNVNMLVSAVAGASLQGQWVIPQDMYDTMPNKQDYALFEPANNKFDPQGQPAMTNNLVEFSSADDAKAFLATSCTGVDCAGSKPMITYFGSNSVLLSDMVAMATKGLGIAVLVIGTIAALIMMGMVGRVIGDSRRETAVFRAIGARRNDIRAVYAIYTVALSLLIAGVALLVGFAVALWIDYKWAAEATAQAQVTFIGVEGSERFRLIGLWWAALGVVVTTVVAAGLISMLLPLSRNLARSPIKDMRDDT
ncbi:MAG TPA: ABC transporter permease [Candidatus Saccharimonadales bacterium]|jgi:hypothetical protein|nr:ABC transporter permease [Candidatus Saccharimonadales bacterium]